MITHKKTNWPDAFEKSKKAFLEAQEIEKELTKVMKKYLKVEEHIKECFFSAPEIDCHLTDSPISTAKTWNNLKKHLIKVRLSENEHNQIEADEVKSFDEAVYWAMMWLLKLGPPELIREFESLKTNPPKEKKSGKN